MGLGSRRLNLTFVAISMSIFFVFIFLILLASNKYSKNDYLAKIIVERGMAQPVPDSIATDVDPIIPNGKPSVSGVIAIDPNYCYSGPAITITWSYEDPEGEPQGAYQVIIDDDSDFSSPYDDSGIVESSSTLYSTSLGSNYDTTYYVKVWIWDDQGDQSVTYGYVEFDTSPIPAPQVNFTWDPRGVQISNSVSFTDLTVPTPEVWYWELCDPLATITECEVPISTDQNPDNVYYVETLSNPVIVKLTVADSLIDPIHTCTTTKKLFVNEGFPIPNWKEVLPF